MYVKWFEKLLYNYNKVDGGGWLGGGGLCVLVCAREREEREKIEKGKMKYIERR